MNIAPNKIKRILVVRNDRFGEFLLNIPALRALQETFPQARITLVVDPSLNDLSGKIPYVSELLFWKRGRHFIWEKLNFLWQLYRRSFDAAVILNPTKGMNIFTALAGIPVRAGYQRKWDFLLTHSLMDTKAEGKKHEVQANLELVGLLGAKTLDTNLTLNLRNNITERNLIAVHPFTSDQVKQWPLIRFKELIQRLVKLRKGTVVVIGKYENKSRAFQRGIRPCWKDLFKASSSPQQVAGYSGKARDKDEIFDFADTEAVNFVDKTNLSQLAYLLSRCKILISCDSGPVHLAGCVNTPVVALFRNDMRGKNPERWGPWSESNIVIARLSLEQISVDNVEQAAVDLLNKSGQKKALDVCDIIIPVFNQLDYTKRCIDSIIRNTVYPRNIIVIDDASGLETKNYLRELKQTGKIILYENQDNLGWVASVNKGIKNSAAGYICVMNNDVEVYPGWLSEMINAAKAKEKIGIVNPTWEIPKYFYGARVDFYHRVAARRCAEYIETDWARGFCFLIKRPVIDAIGGLDDAFSPGYYDDRDYSLRAAKAGFICIQALGSFVWHYKNISYKKKLGEKNFNKILAEKERLFRSRWGNPSRILAVVGLPRNDNLKRLETFLLFLLRNQSKVSVMTSFGGLTLNHTNCKIKKCWGVLLRLGALVNILNNLRFGKSKRYNFIIATDNIAAFLKKFAFVTKNFVLLTFEDAVRKQKELI